MTHDDSTPDVPSTEAPAVIPPPPVYDPAAAAAVAQVAAAPSGKVIWPWLVGAGVLVVGAVVAVLAFVIPALLGTGAQGGGTGPGEATSRYTTAWWEGDCVSYEAVTTAAFREGFEGGHGTPYSCEAFETAAAEYYEGDTALSYVVGRVEIDGETAVVEGRETGRDPDGTSTSADWSFELVLEDGNWLIDSETLLDE